jgi:hypothetical protein
MRSFAVVLTLMLSVVAHAGEKAIRVLFIGNSLTYQNDLPAAVRNIAAKDGMKVITQMIAKPDYALEDHLRDGIARTLRKGRWDFVVVQQGPSSMDDSRRLLIRDVQAIAAAVRSPARIAVLMVWPPRARWAAMDRVAESHRLAADAVQGVLIPAGRALDAELQRDPSAPLFAPDGFHPTQRATEIVALTVYRSLRAAPGS